MDKDTLLKFLLQARTKTYAGGTGKVEPLLPGSHQLEYKEGDWSYIDVYNMGNAIFIGIETVYFKNKPVLSMSYFGNFQGMTEEEIDTVLRKALIAKWDTTRLWHQVEWSTDNFQYLCQAEDNGSIDEFSGTEKVIKSGKQAYYFYYAGAFIG